ncbi:MAG: 4-(cytidine 5'-diphospho)-2-C-methyl-D-erythritol kinase [Oscillospiraceae bacterium]|nr:4-(cytidine 5'-diphospho)-2-C-methyl-D-erythritol kinase [Oscillospiraceae bacterium]
MKLLARAKLNLFFDITGINDTHGNGYHDVAAVNTSIDLADEVSITLNSGEGVTVRCDMPGIPAGHGNTCYRAATTFCDYTRIKTGIDIFIAKKIPVQSGMGGASADAAAVLTGLNLLTRANLPTEKLIEIGAKVGADVPFCQIGGVAFCEGIGEKLTSLPSLDKTEIEFVIIKPEFGISTAECYAKYDELLQSGCIPQFSQKRIDEMIRHVKSSESAGMTEVTGIAGIAGITDSLYNVLEKVVFSVPDPNQTTGNIGFSGSVPHIKQVLMDAGAMGALMTGSGSAVFGIFKNIGAKAMSELTSEFREVYLQKPAGCGVELLS